MHSLVLSLCIVSLESCCWLSRRAGTVLEKIMLVYVNSTFISKCLVSYKEKTLLNWCRKVFLLLIYGWGVVFAKVNNLTVPAQFI